MADQNQPPSRLDASMSLLTGLLTETLDPGYAQAAARRAASGPEAVAAQARAHRYSPTVLLGVAAMALVLVVAAIQVRRTAPQVAKERSDLIQRIQAGEASDTNVENSIAGLRAELQKAQSEALGPSSAAGQKFTALSISTGGVPVTGPGVEVIVDDAPGSQNPNGGNPRQQTGPDLGRVQDVDLQHVVNGLWAAGAEAIAVNGQRLTARSAIRTAGSAILVDFRPLTPPYSVQAIGDPRNLAAKFSENTDGRYMFALKSQYGIRFDVNGSSDLSLPAAAQLGVTLAVPVP
jgi:uncharacterized protein YlxW (UPF0749 family)